MQNSSACPVDSKAYLRGMDEFSKGKGHDYGLVLVNLASRKVIDVTDGGKTKRTAKRLLGRLNPQKVRACVIDMWGSFRDACQSVIPEAVVVVDRFHVVKLANETMDKVRKRIREGLESRQKKEALFKHKDLLWLGMENLTPMQEERLWELLSWDRNLSHAYELKELLRAIYAGKHPQRAANELDNWINGTKSSGIEEMIEAAKSFVNWRKEILNFWVHPITNAITEGKINKIKALRRRAYNYNNFQVLRLKILEQELV